MKKHTLLLALAILFFTSVRSQTEFGIDYRYTMGKSYAQHSIGSSVENFSGKSSWLVGVNYNLSNFSSGKTEDKGKGFGVFAGYRYGFSYGTSGNFFGGFDASIVFGAKSLTVISPSLEFGYHYTFNNFGKGGFASPAVGGGYNINAGSKDENFDESAFFRARLGVGYRF